MTSCLDSVWLTGGGCTCPNMFKRGVLPKHDLGYMSSIFSVTILSLNLHPAWVIAINSNDVMTRQSLIDRCGGVGGTCPNMFKWGTSPLFIVKVRTLRPDNEWVIAIFSKVLPYESSRPRSCVAKWRHPVHSSMTHRYLQKMCCQWRQGSPSTLCARTAHFLTTKAFC